MKVADLFAVLRIKPDPKSLRRAEQLLQSAKKAAAAVAVAGVGAAAALHKTIGAVANTADEFAKMSRKVGISIEKLQQLEFAAELSGTNIGTLRTGLQRFARTADDAGQGLKSAQEPFKRLGIDIKDTSGEIKDLDTLLLEASDRFAEMPNGTEKTALAMKAFGRAGAELIPLLNEGSGGIERMRAEFAKTGAQISSQDAKAFEEYNDTVLRIKTSLIGLRNQAVVALLPHIKKMSKQFLAWVKANREMLKQKLLKFMQLLIKAVVFLGKSIVFLLDHGESLIRLFVAWKLAIMAITAAQAIMAAGGIRAAIKMAIAWATAAAPLFLMVALVALLALAIEDFIGFLTGKDSVIGRMFGDSADQWRKDIISFLKWFRDGIREAVEWGDALISGLTGRKTMKEKRAEAERAKAMEGFAEAASYSIGFNQRQAAAAQREAEIASTLSAARSRGVFAPGAATTPPSVELYPGLNAGGAPLAPTVNAQITINETTSAQATGREVEAALARSVKEATPR
jgi:hypothetical protein